MGAPVHMSTKWLLGELVVMGVAMGVLGALGFPLLMPYRWHLLLHTSGALMLLGNIIVTGVWMTLAVRTHDMSTIRFAAKTVNWMDVAFTIPGILLIVWNGLTIVDRWGGVFGQSWIVLGSILFSTSGVVYVALIVPDQERLIRLSASAEAPRGPDQRFLRVFRRWGIFGLIAIILPLTAYALMVLRPALW